jgi:hypothetical protein
MSRRSNRQRRKQRRARDRILPNPEPFDKARAMARWQGLLKTATARGANAPLFEGLVLGPIVESSLPCVRAGSQTESRRLP